MSDLATSSFDFYDGVRILLPGAIVAGLYEAVVKTFALHAPLPTSDALTALIIVAVVGLSFYFVDLPARSVLYSAGLPHKILERWGKPPKGRSMQNIYFVLMDTVMPPAIRSRAQYYNSMFRIGFELVVVFCITGNGVIAAALLTAGPAEKIDVAGAQDVMTAACFLFGVLAACALATAYLKASDKGKAGDTTKKERISRVRERLTKQVPCVDRVTLLVAAAFSALYMCAHHAIFLVVAVALATAVWSFRYLRGVFSPAPGSQEVGIVKRLSGEERRNIEASSSTLVVCFTALVTTIPPAVRLPAGTHLTLGVALGWTAVMLAGAVLMLFRGHERKLWGAYFTVSTWMSFNRDEIVSQYKLVVNEAGDSRGSHRITARIGFRA